MSHMLYNENICHKIQASADHNLHYYTNYELIIGYIEAKVYFDVFITLNSFNI